MRYIKCPNCEEIQYAKDCLELDGNDGDEFEVDCSDCGTHFEVVTKVFVMYEAKKILTGDYFCLETLEKTKGTGMLLLDKHCPNDFDLNLRAKTMVNSGYMRNLGTEGSTRYYGITDKGKELLDSFK